MASKVNNTMVEKVTIQLPLSRERQEDVFVSVNGESYLIKRGEKVEVPVYIKEVLDNAENMEMLAIERSKNLQN